MDRDELELNSSVVWAVLVLVIVLLLAIWYICRLGQFDNIWPEIVGFCLDGIFFVFILGLYQKRQEKKRIKKAKVALKNTLGHFIKDFVWWLSVGTVQDMNKISQKREDTTYMLPIVDQAKNAIEALNKGRHIPSGMVDPIKRYGKKESIMLKCMLPIASQMDANHLKIWVNIIQSLDDIIEAENDQNINSASLNFLNKVVEFIEAP